jgi:hypothetical protein
MARRVPSARSKRQDLRVVRRKLIRKQLPWMAGVVVGSVLREGSGAMRVVREVTRYNDGDLRCVTFAIRRCSWTHRCYTILGYTDLIQRHFSMVPVRPRRLRSALDRVIHTAIHQPAWEPYAAKCCDVEGVA